MRMNFNQVQAIAQELSSRCETYDFKVQKRNNYIALDKFTKTGEMINVIYVGTTRQVYDFIWGMMEGQLI